MYSLGNIPRWDQGGKMRDQEIQRKSGRMRDAQIAGGHDQFSAVNQRHCRRKCAQVEDQST
jgi:hypothetical protein